ncbi:MAG TPA: cold shock domain-containing protein [Bacteroidales bacterium]|jgi:cold shock CspA family protein|nr:cold shock domain-containing protein [Bacteroidales bacterium]
MGRSQETSGKKEVRNRKDKKRKEKEQKRAKKKIDGKRSSFDDMIAYVDEFGMISSTPPDPNRNTTVNPETIELGATRSKSENPSSFERKGVISFFDESKGFGFIRDLETSERIFLHVSNLLEPVKENNVVIYEAGKGPKGITAIKVRLFKE